MPDTGQTSEKDKINRKLNKLQKANDSFRQSVEKESDQTKKDHLLQICSGVSSKLSSFNQDGEGVTKRLNDLSKSIKKLYAEALKLTLILDEGIKIDDHTTSAAIETIIESLTDSEKIDKAIESIDKIIAGAKANRSSPRPSRLRQETPRSSNAGNPRNTEITAAAPRRTSSSRAGIPRPATSGTPKTPKRTLGKLFSRGPAQ